MPLTVALACTQIWIILMLQILVVSQFLLTVLPKLLIMFVLLVQVDTESLLIPLPMELVLLVHQDVQFVLPLLVLLV